MIDPLASPAAAIAATSSAAPPAKAALPKVARQFEAVFLRQMIGAMRQASLGDGLFSSSAEDQFRDMGDAKLADSMAGSTSHGGFGIAELLARQLAKAGATPGATPAADGSTQ